MQSGMSGAGSFTDQQRSLGSAFLDIIQVCVIEHADI